MSGNNLSANDEFDEQLRMQELYGDPKDGDTPNDASGETESAGGQPQDDTPYEWDLDKKAWFPKVRKGWLDCRCGAWLWAPLDTLAGHPLLRLLFSSTRSLNRCLMARLFRPFQYPMYKGKKTLWWCLKCSLCLINFCEGHRRYIDDCFLLPKGKTPRKTHL